jgi:hypothetical protein
VDCDPEISVKSVRLSTRKNDMLRELHISEPLMDKLFVMNLK